MVRTFTYVHESAFTSRTDLNNLINLEHNRRNWSDFIVNIKRKTETSLKLLSQWITNMFVEYVLQFIFCVNVMKIYFAKRLIFIILPKIWYDNFEENLLTFKQWTDCQLPMHLVLIGYSYIKSEDVHLAIETIVKLPLVRFERGRR